MPEDLQLLRDFISRQVAMSDEQWTLFSEHWQPFETARKVTLTATGEVERYVYFVLEGAQRAFFTGSDMQEATVVFTYPYSFSGVADSLLTRQPSAFQFETLTRSRFLRIHHSHFFELLSISPELSALILKLTAHTLSGALLRMAELQCLSAKERFSTMLRRSPHMLHTVPHKYLASYLGIDASTFSKLLANVRI